MSIVLLKVTSTNPLTVSTGDLSGLRPATMLLNPGDDFFGNTEDLSTASLISRGFLTVVTGPVSVNVVASTLPDDTSLGHPTLDGSGLIKVAELPTVTVAHGGTSATSLTANGVLIGNGTSAISASTLTNGQLLIGSTGVAPVAAGLTGTPSQITVTPGAGSITLATPQNIDTTATPQFAALGVNTAVGAAGTVTTTGNIQAGGNLIAVSNGTILWNTRSLMTSPANGQITLLNNSSTANASLLHQYVVATKTASSYAISATENLTQFNNNGAAGQVAFTLPASAPGMLYGFYVATAQNVRISGTGAETIRQAASVSTATTGHIDNTTIGGYIVLICHVAGQWVAMGTPEGTWAVT